MPSFKRIISTFIMLLAVTFTIASCSEEILDPTMLPDPESFQVTLDYGTLHTVKTATEKVYTYKGVPFAQPPIGELRFRAAVAIDPVTDPSSVMIDATEYQEPCVQKFSSFSGLDSKKYNTEGLIGSEDCLYLDLYVPFITSQNEKKPVVVWIHGGGNTVGASHIYKLDSFAYHTSAVVVSVQYRLGPMGFFADNGLMATASNPLDKTANFALTDLLQALRWVNKNIAAFGGDPNNVIIMGESAGARDVLALMAMPNGYMTGLAHKAISMSGLSQSYSWDYATSVDSEGPSTGKVIQTALVNSGKSSSTAQATQYWQTLSAQEQTQMLQAFDVAAIFDAATNEEGRVGIVQIVEDGTTVAMEGIVETFAQGKELNIPTILGTVRDEMKLFMAFNPLHVDSWFNVLYRIKDEDSYNLQAHYESLFWKASAVDGLSQLRIKHGRGDKTWIYRYDYDDHPTRFFNDFSKLFGAAHGSELPIFFNDFDMFEGLSFLYGSQPISELKPEDRTADVKQVRLERMSVYLMEYLHHFFYTADPGGARDFTPQWLPVGNNPAKMPMLVIDGGPEKYNEIHNTHYDIQAVVEELANDASVADALKCNIVNNVGFLTEFDENQVATVCK